MRADPLSGGVLALPRIVWLTAAIGAALPHADGAPGATTPPKRKPSPTATQPAPADPAPRATSKPEVPPVPEIPPDGPLSRSDLIQLAIQAHPDFWRFRGEVALYLEAEAAAYDWRDPELRLGIAHEFEEDLEGPYEERHFGTSTEDAFFDTSSTNRFSERTVDGPESGSSTMDRQTIRNNRIQTETIRKITPGKYQDIIEETTYEVESRRETETDRRRGSDQTTREDTTNERSRRRVLSRSREVRTHPNSVYGDEGFVIQVRFFIPHPWEMKAKAARARAEADLSNHRLRSEVRDLVFDVGRLHDELQFRYSWHQANLRLSELHQEHLKVAEEEAARFAPVAGLANNLFDPLDVPRARLEISKAREEVFDSRREMNLAREDLCLLCGLADPTRIVLTNSLRLRKLDEPQLDLPTLVDIARTNRPELGEMLGRADVERARLREVKALRLPWFNDLRVGFHRNIGDGYRDRDEFSALLTLNLPLFSPWQNKSHRQHEAAIASYEEGRRILGQRIDQQVAFAIQAVHEAAAGLADFAEGEKLLLVEEKKIEAEAAAAPDKAPRIRLTAKERLITSSRSRLQALYHYNQAVARLEQAIGLPIEEAFAAPAK